MNTGWKHWDFHLQKFRKKEQLDILELGVYKGKATVWFLNNLFSYTNKKSRLYAVDTFRGSPEYVDVNFNEIKKSFIKNVSKTNHRDQVKLMEMTTYDALIKLNYLKKIKFDIIFIDASHVASDVLADAVLSWTLLKNNGVLIFDDYQWKKLSPKEFRPKMAIDAFCDIMKHNITVLHKGWQVIIKKKKSDIIPRITFS